MAFDQLTHMPALIRAVQDGTHKLKKPPTFIIGQDAGYDPHNNVYMLPGEPDSNMSESDFMQLMFLGLHEGKAETELSLWDPGDPRWKGNPDRKVIVNALNDVRIDKLANTMLPGYQASADYHYADCYNSFVGDGDGGRTCNPWNIAYAIKLGTYMNRPDIGHTLGWDPDIADLVEDEIGRLNKLPIDDEEPWIQEALRLMSELDLMDPPDMPPPPPQGGDGDGEGAGTGEDCQSGDGEGEGDSPASGGQGGPEGDDQEGRNGSDPAGGEQEQEEEEPSTPNPRGASRGGSSPMQVGESDDTDFDEKQHILDKVQNKGESEAITCQPNGYVPQTIFKLRPDSEGYENDKWARPIFDFNPEDERKWAEQFRTTKSGVKLRKMTQT